MLLIFNYFGITSLNFDYKRIIKYCFYIDYDEIQIWFNEYQFRVMTDIQLNTLKVMDSTLINLKIEH